MDLSFIEIAKIVAKKSKDSTKVGAVIVNGDKIIATGRNGMVAGCDEKYMSYSRPLKYQLIIHAEINAILYAKTDLTDTTMYITHSCCPNCLKTILQAGIRTVYYDILYDKFEEIEEVALRRLIKSTNAKIINVNNGLSLMSELS
jgi:dCMP deaminase